MVPKNIYQFWDNRPLPVEIARLSNAWRRNHASFGYFLYDDYATVKLIERNFSRDVLHAYLISKLPTMRSDLFRYIVLFLYGGIYVDADEGSISSIERFVDLSKDLVVRRRSTDRKPEDYSPLSRDFVIQGGFIAAKPRLEVIERSIMQAVRNIHHRVSNNPWLVTGPGVLGEQIRKYYRDESRSLCVLELDYYKRFVKLYGGTLEYKKGGRHWSKVMQRESIFHESIAKSRIPSARSKGLCLYARLLGRH